MSDLLEKMLTFVQWVEGGIETHHSGMFQGLTRCMAESDFFFLGT